MKEEAFIAWFKDLFKLILLLGIFILPSHMMGAEPKKTTITPRSRTSSTVNKQAVKEANKKAYKKGYKDGYKEGFEDGEIFY